MDVHQARECSDVLSGVLSLCAKGCKTLLPEHFAIRTLWNYTSRFEFRPDEVHDSMRSVADLNFCSQLIPPVLNLLTALLPHISPIPMSTPDSSGLSSARTHSRAAAASRAVRVLQERKIAERVKHGLYSAELLFLLASILQMVDTLCGFLATHPSTAKVACMLFESGTFIESVSSTLSFLLRCLRHRRLPVQPPLSAELPCCSYEQVLLATCQNACYASVSLMQAMLAFDGPALSVLSGIPTQFFQTLSCLACEGLPADDAAAWEVAKLPSTAVSGKLTNLQASSLLYCPASLLLSRRVSPHASKHCHEDASYPERAVLEVLQSHLQLEDDGLLSENFILIPDRPNMEPHTELLAAQPLGVDDDRSNAYFLPRARDDSLQQFTQLLPSRSSPFFTAADGSPHSSSQGGVHMSRLTAVLLSLQHSREPLPGQGERPMCEGHADLRWSLLAAARFSSALATQLLVSARNKHKQCGSGPDPRIDSDEDDNEWVADQGTYRCQCCVAVAEGITAVNLQILRLHNAARATTGGRDGELKTEPALEFVKVWVEV